MKMIKLQYKQYNISITENYITISVNYERPLRFSHYGIIDITTLVEDANRIWNEEVIDQETNDENIGV